MNEPETQSEPAVGVKYPIGLYCPWCEGRIGRGENAEEARTALALHAISCPRTPGQIALGSKVRLLDTALREAIECIKTFHGEFGWDIYCANAPEMKRFRAALGEKGST